MWWVVDRIEGAIAVMVSDGGQVLDLPARGLKEGQVYRLRGRKFVRDRSEEKRRKAASRRLLEELKRRDPGGDVQL